MEDLSPTDRLCITDEQATERSPFERDSDRILASTAFHRLAGVTQVVPAGKGNAAHTRLTHSLKVGRIARRLCNRIRRQNSELFDALDPDCAEAAGLAHDLGHPPFGHVAEQELDLLLSSAGGFEGNAQTFRVVTRLSQRFADSPGLNLTRGTLDGLIKYPWPRCSSHEKESDRKRWLKFAAYPADNDAYDFARKPHGESEDASLIASIMDWADDLTYALHDATDFFRAGILPLDRLCTQEQERESFFDSIRYETQRGQRLEGKDANPIIVAADRLFSKELGIAEAYDGTNEHRQLLRERVSHYTRRYMEAFSVTQASNSHLGYRAERDEDLVAEVEALKQLTWHYVINRPALATVQSGQREVVRHIFEVYLAAAKEEEQKHLLPPLERQIVAGEGTPAPERVVADFISRLTEDRILELHGRLIGTDAWALQGGEH